VTLKRKADLRKQLLAWIEEAEDLYEQQHQPQGATASNAAPRSRPRTPTQSSAARAEEKAVPLSFLNENQQDQTRERLKAIYSEPGTDSVERTRQCLNELERELTRVDPGVPQLCGRALGTATSLDGAVCSVFAIMSERDIGAYERAWLSDLGSFLVELKSQFALIDAAPRASVPAPAQVGSSQSAKAPDPSPKQSPASPQPIAESPMGDTSSSTEEESPALQPSASPTEPGPTAAAAESAGLTPKLRQQLKLSMVELFADWSSEEQLLADRVCVEVLQERMQESGVEDHLTQCLQGRDFVQAEAAVEAMAAATPQEAKLQRQGIMLLQSVQTAYVQRQREILNVRTFVDQDQRRQSLSDLLLYWSQAYEAAEGKREERRAKADMETLSELSMDLKSSGLPPSCQDFMDKQIAQIATIEQFWLLLVDQQAPTPLTGLFRSQLKGFIEDIDLLRAFEATETAGWLKLIDILGREHPRTESELVAILARKVDALGRTEAHQNFLNPTRNLRLVNFLTWVRNGYPMSPSFSDTEPERLVLQTLAWLIEQLTQLAMMGGDEGELDGFLEEDAASGYGVYRAYFGEVGRRFQPWFSAVRAN
jgi:hypothetical protein